MLLTEIGFRGVAAARVDVDPVISKSCGFRSSQQLHSTPPIRPSNSRPVFFALGWSQWPRTCKQQPMQTPVNWSRMTSS